MRINLYRLVMRGSGALLIAIVAIALQTARGAMSGTTSLHAIVLIVALLLPALIYVGYR
jgi:hypothetical protein